MVDLDTVFADFDDTDPESGGGKNPKIKCNGEFVIEIDEVKILESKRYAAVYFVAEFRVIKSNHVSIKEGRLYSWKHNLLNEWYGLSNAKVFVSACAGFGVKTQECRDLTRKDIEESWSEAQPLKGCQLNLKTSYKETEGRFNFWVHDWMPLA